MNDGPYLETVPLSLFKIFEAVLGVAVACVPIWFVIGLISGGHFPGGVDLSYKSTHEHL